MVLDCNYLAYRALFAMKGALSHGGEMTDVLYGFFRDLSTLYAEHQSERFVFCWDSRMSLRKRECPTYKSRRNRDALTPEERAIFDDMHRQTTKLKDKILPRLGYANIFERQGYESDDIIASVSHSLIEDSPRNKVIIVSSDQDLYQCLGNRVHIWNPHKKQLITKESFQKEFNVIPEQWADVKAMAGCSSDDIIGIKGVGEITAAKYLNGTLKPTSKAFDSIVKGTGVWEGNRRLVTLPFPGTPKFKLKPNTISVEKWRKVMKKYGMRSLMNEPPTIKKDADYKGKGLR